MKKILVLTSKKVDKKQKFVDLIRKNFKNNEIQIELQEIASSQIYLEKDKIELKIGGVDIKEYSLVYFRGILRVSMFTTSALSICLEKLGVKYFDTMYSNTGSHRSKLASLAVLSANNLPIPKTVYFADQDYSSHFDETQTLLGLPFIAKEMSLQRGKGVHLIKNFEDLKNLPEESVGGSKNDYFFQEFIDKDHEYRVLVLGKTIGVWEEKVKKDNTEFRNNVALGAEEFFYDPKDTPEEIANTAIMASNVLGIEVGGVDIMTERETNKVYLLEINRGPGLTYDENISPEFKAMANFLEDQVNE